MAKVFHVTSTGSTLELDSAGRGKISFTVSNAAGRPLTARAVLVPDGATQAEWLSVEGEAERPLGADGTDQFVVQVQIPAGTEAGTYRFRLDAVSEANPDEDFAEGPAVTLEVAAVAAKKPFPWWILVVAAGVLILGGLILWLVNRGSSGEQADNGPPIAEPVTDEPIVAVPVTDDPIVAVPVRLSSGTRTGAANIHTPVGGDWAVQGVGDVDGDGTADIVWRHDSGQVHYWKMKDGRRTGAADIHTPVGGDWAVQGVGDVDGDGTADIVWRHNSGQVHYWKIKNGRRTGAADIHTPVGGDWAIRGVGNVEGDRTAEIVWQHQSGQVHYWKMKDGKRTGAADIHTPVGGDWSLVGVGDVDDNGTDDIVWRHSSGQMHYWKMS